MMYVRSCSASGELLYFVVVDRVCAVVIRRVGRPRLSRDIFLYEGPAESVALYRELVRSWMIAERGGSLAGMYYGHN